MEPGEVDRRVAAARVGRLATVTPEGRPHLVPCCFVLAADTVYSAVDAKPKTTRTLRRLANLRATGVAALLVDHYEEDWSALWWVRLDGRGRVLESGEERDRALDLLAGKYDQYRRQPPPGPVVAVDIEDRRAWP
ncbi:MAG TPA: TIGR03668 family PPOX class F420-dependent oxidoreductase [Acidimicrobiales bacterium]|nr:TIGR03668 family PPOX class F420-dependent oxidoreductase [Acidimicrobiales bacterium]